MSELVKCATCKTEKPFSEMQTCMHAEREHSVCDMNCMIKFYKGEIKPDAVVTPDLEEMGKLGMNPKEYHLHKENLELTAQLAKANEREKRLEKILQRYESEQLQPLKLRVKELERKVEAERFKKEEFVRWVDKLIEEQKELREQRFRTFGNEEYLIFFDDGEDYPDSMVAPVVMSADKFRELYYAREQLRKEQDSE